MLLIIGARFDFVLFSIADCDGVAADNDDDDSALAAAAAVAAAAAAAAVCAFDSFVAFDAFLCSRCALGFFDFVPFGCETKKNIHKQMGHFGIGFFLN